VSKSSQLHCDKINYNKKVRKRLRTIDLWTIYGLVLGAIAMVGWVIYCEINIHYLIEFNGKVVQKQKIPPKELPELIVRGSDNNFLIWKWKGINFDSVQIDDSIVKKRGESHAYWYRKNPDGTYNKNELTY
jgi:hypothetical protein